jgi:D-glycero-alpha-D-manno-heptose-7-phosphate kinase
MKIISYTPTRISLFGGGTDLPEFYNTYGGAVISLAINLRQRLTLYSGDEQFESPYSSSPDNPFFYKILEKFHLGSMHHCSFASTFDGIMGAGLGSSASAAVGMLGAINKLKSLGLTRSQIAQGAWELENKVIGWHGGKQDQYAATYGGFNHIAFGNDIEVTPIAQHKGEALREYLTLFYAGGTRKSHKIQQGMKKLSKKQIQALGKINRITLSALLYLVAEQYEEIGRLMDVAWKYKKESNKVSTPEIDEIYEYAMTSGALGGKLLGAGGGGYMVFMTKPENREQFLEKMKQKNLQMIDFDIDFNGLDCRII